MDFDYEKNFEVDGLTFRMRVVRDPYMHEPWKRYDGHDIVSQWTSREPDEGERVIAQDGSRRRYYDFAATTKIAKRDGWDISPEEATKRGLKTKAQITAAAVEDDYQRMKAWCDGEWWWVFVLVELLDTEGNVIERPECGGSLDGIESDKTDYHLEVARDELAPEIAARFKGQDEICIKIRKEDTKVTRFFCYEISTDTIYHLGAYGSESERDRMFHETMKFLEAVKDVPDTYAIGTADASDWKEALDLIRAGKWKYFNYPA